MSKMPFFTSKKIREILAKENLKPLKRLGQHFLVSKVVLNKIIEAAELKPQDIVLEAGPGIGVLTLELAKKAKKVIAVEKDKGMAGILKGLLAENRIKNVKVVQDDILKIQNPNVKCQTKLKIQMSKNYKVTANLPYNIATAVIMKFLKAKKPPRMMVVMVQKEVAQRICAKPPQMNKLAVFCQFYSQPKIINYVKRTAFWPQPKVDSAILKLKPLSMVRPGSDPGQTLKFAEIVRAGFSHPRKQLLNNFSKELNLNRDQAEKWLTKNNIKPNQRAETLTANDWLKLTESYPQHQSF